jgi:hypothetical protein
MRKRIDAFNFGLAERIGNEIKNAGHVYLNVE